MVLKTNSFDDIIVRIVINLDYCRKLILFITRLWWLNAIIGDYLYIVVYAININNLLSRSIDMIIIWIIIVAVVLNDPFVAIAAGVCMSPDFWLLLLF